MAGGGGSHQKREKRFKKKFLELQKSRGGFGTPVAPWSISDAVLLDVWRYLAAEYASCSQHGTQDHSSLRLLADVLIGGAGSSARPFRIFPVRGSSGRRRDCHFTDTPCVSLLKHLLRVEGGAAE